MIAIVVELHKLASSDDTEFYVDSMDIVFNRLFGKTYTISYLLVAVGKGDMLDHLTLPIGKLLEVRLKFYKAPLSR